MAKKYIDADAFADYCCANCVKYQISCYPTSQSCDFIEDLRSFLGNAPAADVAEVRHGKWIDNSYYKMDAKGNEIICADRDYVCCSECKFSFNKLVNCVEEFLCCPYCGARMDGGDSDG